MSVWHDRDGQPASELTADRESTRDLEHLLGLCRGLVADNKLVPEEVVYLDTWLKEHHAVCETWPGQILVERLHAILADGEVDEDEAIDLQQTIEKLIGGGLEDGTAGGGATQLPVNNNAVVALPGAALCYTGKFIRGSRGECARLSKACGALQSKGVNKKTDYLVVGHLASRAWANTSHGRKIEKALELQGKGSRIKIINEYQWIEAIAESSAL